MKADAALEFIGFVNKDNELQGVDAGSGGEPWTPTNPSSIKLWDRERIRDAEKYLQVINYGNKGYRLVRVYINFGAL